MWEDEIKEIRTRKRLPAIHYYKFTPVPAACQ
jgi:hypothetical protein